MRCISERFYGAMQIFIDKYYRESKPLQYSFMKAGLKLRHKIEKIKLQIKKATQLSCFHFILNKVFHCMLPEHLPELKTVKPELFLPELLWLELEE
ncbi:hypothetical protein [Chryseobacterium indoltheticum]|uniref:hypothetical protein n=1 Tax=Chryseobacterium indoltheticum TaxID=254 RepID=UPI003F4923C0